MTGRLTVGTQVKESPENPLRFGLPNVFDLVSIIFGEVHEGIQGRAIGQGSRLGIICSAELRDGIFENGDILTWSTLSPEQFDKKAL